MFSIACGDFKKQTLIFFGSIQYPFFGQSLEYTLVNMHICEHVRL